MPTMRKLARRNPSAPLAPKAAWRSRQSDFVGAAMVSDRFSIDGRADRDYEFVWDADLHARPYWRSEDGYEIRAVPDPDFEPETMALLSPAGGRCGFYSGGQLWIDPEHRGRGLGAELVLAMADALGASPVRHHGGLGFSGAGIEAHREAWRRAVERAAEAGLDVPPHLVAAVAVHRGGTATAEGAAEAEADGDIPSAPRP